MYNPALYSNEVEIHPALNFLLCHKASQNVRQVPSESGTTASTHLLQLLLIWQVPLCHPLEGTVTVVDTYLIFKRKTIDR